MIRKARAQIAAERDQIVAILRGSARPLTANEIADRMPPEQYRNPCPGGEPCEFLRTRWKHVCDGAVHYVTSGWTGGSLNGSHLMQMRRNGTLTSTPTGFGNILRWSVSAARVEIDDLEAAFAL
jgi:hypothetical protein